ncbi:MAG: leucyl-tRNA synthetase, partial [Microgenomates group bacterium LiPW_16]
SSGDAHLLKIMHKTIKEVTEDIENLRYNTALAHIMEYHNYLSSNIYHLSSNLKRQALEMLVLLLAPFAPHMTEELWCEVLGNKFSIHQHPWPKYDPTLIKEEITTIVVEINGKVRDKINVPAKRDLAARDKSEVEKLACQSEKVKKYLAGKKIKKVIFVPGKLINFVF